MNSDPIREGILRKYRLKGDALIESEGDFVKWHIANLGPMSECFNYAKFEGFNPSNSICKAIEVEDGPSILCLLYPSNKQRYLELL